MENRQVNGKIQTWLIKICITENTNILEHIRCQNDTMALLVLYKNCPPPRVKARNTPYITSLLSDSPGLVYFPVGLVDFIHHVPNWKVPFLDLFVGR